MKNILILNGHPTTESFNMALTKAYAKGAQAAGANVTQLHIGSLNFDPNLAGGYSKRTELEPDLLAAWEQIKAADHLVWIHPVWWGGLPAKTKGFIDRLFLPGMAFSYRENSVWWDKLLKGKTGHIVLTADQPGWYYRFMYGRPSINMLKKSTLEFCGVKPVKVTFIGSVRGSTAEKREGWIKKLEKLGEKKA